MRKQNRAPNSDFKSRKVNNNLRNTRSIRRHRMLKPPVVVVIQSASSATVSALKLDRWDRVDVAGDADRDALDVSPGLDVALGEGWGGDEDEG
jgi:hypothetical protein